MLAATVANFSSTPWVVPLHLMAAAAAVAGDTSHRLRDPAVEGAGPGITITGGIEAEGDVVI